MSDIDFVTCLKCHFQWRAGSSDVCYRCVMDEQQVEIKRLRAELESAEHNLAELIIERRQATRGGCGRGT
mgnify:CR=1 FL=1